MNKRNDERMYDRQIEECCKLANYIDMHPDIKNDELTRRWKSVFFLITKRMGFNKESRKYLWDHLVEGNWEHIHKNEVEKTWSRDKWLNDFHLDLWYCSDRMSFDRLTRLHWQYRQCLQSYLYGKEADALIVDELDMVKE